MTDSPRSENFDLESELRGLIVARIGSHERTQQREIGASELGTPCDRKLALKLAEVDAVPEQLDPEGKWRPTVGTAVHEWLAEMLRAANQAYWQEDWNTGPDAECDHEWCSDGEHQDRWLVEYSTPIGTIDGKRIPGNLDVYDRLSQTMVDWKIVGPTALKKYRKEKDPGPQYRVQVQLYGRGLARAGGEDVKYVGIMFLGSNAELKDSVYWEEPYDPEVGKTTLARARALKRLIDERGDEVFRQLDTVDDHCSHCAFFSPGSNVPFECPGDPSLTANMEDSFADLLPNGAPGA